jgi:AcrR family transcriptional regulator
MAESATEKRKARLLAVAQELFFSKGYDSTSLDQIVATAGGSKQTIYRFFGSKKGLYYAVVEQVTDYMIGVYSLDGAAVEDYPEVLRQFAHNYLHFVMSDQARDLTRSVVGHSMVSGDVAAKFLELGPNRYMKLKVYLDRVVAAGHLKIANTTLSAQQFLGALRGDNHIRRLADPSYQCTPEQLDEAAEEALAVFLRGYSS